MSLKTNSTFLQVFKFKKVLTVFAIFRFAWISIKSSTTSVYANNAPNSFPRCTFHSFAFKSFINWESKLWLSRDDLRSPNFFNVTHSTRYATAVLLVHLILPFMAPEIYYWNTISCTDLWSFIVASWTSVIRRGRTFITFSLSIDGSVVSTAISVTSSSALILSNPIDKSKMMNVHFMTDNLSPICQLVNFYSLNQFNLYSN